VPLAAAAVERVGQLLPQRPNSDRSPWCRVSDALRSRVPLAGTAVERVARPLAEQKPAPAAATTSMSRLRPPLRLACGVRGRSSTRSSAVTELCALPSASVRARLAVASPWLARRLAEARTSWLRLATATEHPGV